MAATKQEIHVLMVSFAAQGHINPLLRLAKRLISKGLHVSLALTEITRHRMFNSAATSISGVNLLFFSDGLSLDYDRKASLDFYFETLGKFGPIHLSNLIRENFPINGRKKLSCIINNPFVPWVIDVGIDHGIPCAMFWIQPCSIYAIYYRFYNKLNTFPTLINPEFNVELPGLPVLLPGDLPSFVLPSNPFSSIPKLFSDLFLNLEKYDWVLGSSFYELEKDAVDSMSEISPIRSVGPIVPPSLLGEGDDEEENAGVEFWKAEECCIEWLDKQSSSSVIYISFGSITVLPTKQMECVANALKSSKKRFLWVVKLPESPSLGDGKGELPSGFTEETKDQGLIVSWSPQTRVLAHPSIACFITHCGWNSILETTVAGVPVIAYPQWTDQPTNAKLVTDVFRTGLRLKANQDGIVGSDEIEGCIREIMDGPKSDEFKSNAKELKRAAREAVASGGSSDRNIELFVQEVVERSCLQYDRDNGNEDCGLVEEFAKNIIIERKEGDNDCKVVG
ncbi:UDP-glycosyltransferase 84B1-like [Euphorbia lathyris]|uniref:UDP-glycosyltransferase 84B1-like n=1 Tax=Euphorbia lathyris TaxID=212925 RepID=UPI0033142CF9